MRRTIAIIGVAFATIGGAFAGTVLPVEPVDLSQVPVGTCTGAGCTVSSTPTGTFETAVFGSVYPTNPAGAPSTSPVATSFGPSPVIIDSASTAGTGSNANSMYNSPTTSGNHSATILVDLGGCSGAGTNNQGPGSVAGPTGECGVYDANGIYTMINAGGTFGGAGQNITITVEGVSAADVYTTDVFTLLPGIDYRTYDSALLGAFCTAADSIDTSGTSCVGTDNTASQQGTDPNNSNITVYNNVFGAQTSGSTNYYIDEQGLNLGTMFAGGWVDSVLIQYNGPTGSNNHAIQLSGLGVTTPEPGTLALLGLGLGLIAFGAVRSRRTKEAASAE